jgi:hypothetical protein
VVDLLELEATFGDVLVTEESPKDGGLRRETNGLSVLVIAGP